jgi:hypothetical protein
MENVKVAAAEIKDICKKHEFYYQRLTAVAAVLSI